MRVFCAVNRNAGFMLAGMTVRVPANFAEDATFDVAAEGSGGAVFGARVRPVKLGSITNTGVVLDILKTLHSSLCDSMTQRSPNDFQSLCVVARLCAVEPLRCALLITVDLDSILKTAQFSPIHPNTTPA